MLVQAGVLAEWSIGAAYDMWNTEAETRETIQQGEVLATEQSAEEKERYFDTIPLSSPQSVVSFGGRVLVALTITGIPLFFALKAIQFPQNLVKRVTLIPRGVRSNSHPELQIEKSSIWDQLKSSSGHKVSRNTHYLSLDGLELTRGSVVYTGKGENLAQADSGLPFIFALKRGNINSDKDTSRNNGFLMNLVRGTPFIFDRHAAFWGTPIIWDKLFANYVSLKKKDAEVDLLATTSAQGTASPEHTVSTDISKVHLRSIASAQDITSAVNAALKKKNKRKDKKHLRE
ncbi:hypothetical protein NADFUDRAFT_63989 [Nadsonia fulvescens var. elongata DSM 6958]|uniref:Uncharacterized protein n=1 Tax=Nadsonia fulvescens var. elongata DSM 6958 TaxID=857566 RepID=A0A1E3PT26_9ASCO|nr:hypothetical protein NADFUDRAFT_63989 [Nadsonia fulvescens var. elongata DSM 6958]